jgi:hypothetical protein
MVDAQAEVCCGRTRAAGLWLQARVVAVPGLAAGCCWLVGRTSPRDETRRWWREAAVVALRLLGVGLFVRMRRALHSVGRVWQHDTCRGQRQWGLLRGQ